MTQLIFWLLILLPLKSFSSPLKTALIATQTHQKFFKIGVEESEKKKRVEKACDSIKSSMKDFCLEGFYFGKIRNEFAVKLKKGLQAPPESPNLNASDEVKILWSKALGRLMAENRLGFFEDRFAPELFKIDGHGDKYRKYYVEGWAFHRFNRDGYNNTLRDCAKTFYQKHVCLWAIGRASYFNRTYLRFVKSLKKEFISGFLFSKNLLENKERKTFPKNYLRCLEVNHQVECLAFLPSHKNADKRE